MNKIDIIKKIKSLVGIEADIASNTSDISEAKGNISTLQSNVSTAQENIGTLQGDVSTAQENIGTLQGDVTEAQGDIDTLQSDVSTAQENIGTLQGDMSNTKQSVETNTASIGSINNSINTINSTISTIQGNLGGLTKALNLKAVVSSFEAIEQWYTDNEAEKTIGDVFVVKTSNESENNKEYVYVEDAQGNRFEELGYANAITEEITVTAEEFVAGSEATEGLFVAEVSPEEGENFGNVKTVIFMNNNNEEEFCNIELTASKITITNDVAVAGKLVIDRQA